MADFDDYLIEVEPDYSGEYLTLSPNFNISFPAAYRQVRNETDGGNIKVVTMKITPEATASLRFTGVEPTNREYLLDLYFNPLKAYGMARSYVWQHPQTLNYYTVQNISEYNEIPFVDSIRYEISFTIKILGKYTVEPDQDGIIIVTDTPDITIVDTPDITIEDVL